MSKAKLHEVLAVEKTLAAAATKLVKESEKTLSKKNLFIGAMRELHMFDENQMHLDNTEETKLTTTVDENLDYLIRPVSAHWDAVLQKDRTNQTAIADIVIDGTVIAEKVPATFLLGLETKLGEIRKLYDHIGTLASGLDWQLDEEAGRNIYKAKNNDTFKSETVADFRIVVKSTEFHPADVRETSKTVNVGKYTSTLQCGLLTSAEKAARIQRIDTLLLAVKQARQRANNAELISGKIGEVLFNYINKTS